MTSKEIFEIRRQLIGIFKQLPSPEFKKEKEFVQSAIHAMSAKFDMQAGKELMEKYWNEYEMQGNG